MQSNKRKTLLLVEGKSAEVKLFSKILDCFPEINVNKQDILVYGTNLWTLYHALEKEFGSTWYEGEIDFIEFLKSSPVILSKLKAFSCIRNRCRISPAINSGTSFLSLTTNGRIRFLMLPESGICLDSGANRPITAYCISTIR